MVTGLNSDALFTVPSVPNFGIYCEEHTTLKTMTRASKIVIRMDFTYYFLRKYPAPIQIRESFTKRSPFATASPKPRKNLPIPPKNPATFPFDFSIFLSFPNRTEKQFLRPAPCTILIDRSCIAFYQCIKRCLDPCRIIHIELAFCNDLTECSCRIPVVLSCKLYDAVFILCSKCRKSHV